MLLPPALNLPVAVVVCVSVGLVGALVLYLVMEWEDDIGLNITVNPLDETKKSVAAASIHSVDQAKDELAGSSSDDDNDDEYGNQGHSRNEYFSEEDDDYQKHARKVDHQLEWDDAAIEYGPKKV